MRSQIDSALLAEAARYVTLVEDGAPCSLDYWQGLASELATAIGAGRHDVKVAGVRDMPHRYGAVITFEVFAPYYAEDAPRG